MDITNNAPRPPGTAHESYLDSLRGWAILAVVALHVGGAVEGLPGLLDSFLDRGQYGVQLFFVVSAFTLCQSADRSGGPARFQASGFFVRRALRVVPAYWLAAIAYCMIQALGSSPPSGALPKLLAGLLFMNYLQPEWFTGTYPPGGWSIVAEAYFYLAFPFLYAWIRTARQAWIALAVSLCASVLLTRLAGGIAQPSNGILGSLAINATSYFGIVAQLPVFLCGFLAARLDPKLRMWRGSPLVIAAVILSACLVRDIPQSLALLLFGLLFGALLVSLRSHGPRLLVNPLLAGLGRISFSMYLVHFAVISVLLRLWPTPPSGLGSLVSLGVLSLAATVPLSLVSYRYIERPFIALGRRS